MTKRTLSAAMLALGLGLGSIAPALADGAASTRNILLGGAAAAAGTLLIINHNKQVHQRYADDARRQADTQAQANNAQAAYAAERRAYENEVSVNAEYKREVATQHALIETLRRQVVRANVHAAPAAAGSTPVRAAVRPASAATQVAAASWGWGQF